MNPLSLLLNRLPARRNLHTRVLLLCGLLSASSFAQTDTVALSSASVSAGGIATLNLSLTSPAGSEPAAIQWTLTYGAASIASLAASAGSSATAASKTISCSSGVGTLTCIESGMNASIIQNGTIATINVTLSASASGTVPINVTAVAASSRTATSLSTAATGGSLTVAAAVSISTVNCSPSSLSTGGSSTCTITLSQAAPVGGIASTISSNNALLTVPASVTVAAGATTATFTATAGTITTNQTATVTATYNGGSKQSSISLTPPVVVSSLSCNPNSVGTALTSSCTVTLSQAAPTGGAAVTLSSSSALLTVPASATIAAGATTAIFTATAGTITTNGSATITANYNSSSQTATISLAAPVVISSIGCNPAALASGGGSTCTVTLSSAAPGGGAILTLSSNSGLLTVPASVAVASGATTATFAATAGTISSNGSAIVTATYSSSTKTTTLSLTAPVVLSSLGCNQSSLASSMSSTCTVTLSGAAPSGGVAVPLSSNNPLLTVPSSVTVAAGATTGTFTTTAGTITSNQTATVTASYLSVIKTAVFSLTAPIVPSSLSCAPASLGTAVTSTCTLTLSQAAPTGGAVVSISSNNGLLTVPASLTVTGGSTSSTFSATAGTITTNGTAVVTASYNSSSVTATLSLATQTVVGSLNCNGKSVKKLSSTQCTVTLSQAAPASGAIISLASDNSLLTVPSSITVISGATSATFTASAGMVTTTQTADLTASYNGSSQTLAVSLVPDAAVSSLTCIPARLSSNATSACTVTLSAASSGAGAVVSLTTDNPALTVPASVTVAAGATTATFTATAGTIAANGTANVTAAYSGSSQQASFALIPPAVLSSLGCVFTSLGSAATSACTVTLSAPAVSAINISLVSNSLLLTVPSSVTVPAGAITAIFNATTATVTANQTVTVTAAYNGSSQQTTFNLVAPAIITLGCSPASLGTGATSNCTVTLSTAAPSSGASVLIISDNSLLSVPGSVTVAADSSTATFTAVAGTVTINATANINAVYNNSSQATSLSLTGQTTVSSLLCAASALNSGTATNCSVTISSPAPAGGAAVGLASSNPSLTVPAGITIPAGALTSGFTASAGSVNTNQTAVITASLNGGGQTVSLTLLPAQTIITQNTGNSLINGNYFVRQTFFGTDGAGHLTDPRSAMGTVVFDGAGHYSFTGQLLQNNTVVPQTTNGTYGVDAAGIVSLDSLVRVGDKVNARFGSEAIVGSATESVSNGYDFFVAIPAPTAPINNTSVSGSYWAAFLDFSAGTFANARDALFSFNAGGDGTLQPFQYTGHSANNLSGQLTTEQISGGTYAMTTDGSGIVNFGSASNVLTGTKTIYVSQDGNVLLGGTSNGYDILIGIKAPAVGVSNSNWSGPFWAAGLRQDGTSVTGFAGSAVASGSGNLYWTRRLKNSSSGNLDFTEVDSYSLNADGSGTSGLDQVATGAGGNLFLGSLLNTNDASGYGIYFGVRMPAVTGTGLYLNPQGIQNVASYAPTGNPIAPGELIYLYISGLAVVPQTATPPYPMSLGGVTVLINGDPAPLYLVSPTQVVVTVPYATAGPTASIVVQANGQTSNTVTVPVAATAPGIFSLTQNGSGFGAIRHADYSVVMADNPAHSGEVVLIYLTGLGAVNPPLNDGTGGSASPLSLTTVNPSVTVGGSAAAVLFSGMSAYPGLYQINVQLPVIPAGTTALPLVITTPNAFHDQIQIPVAP